MQTSFTGKRNKRGDWRPEVPLHLAPLFAWPTQPVAILKWLFGYPGYFLPWGVIYMVFPVVTWLWFTPALEDMKTFKDPLRAPGPGKRGQSGDTKWPFRSEKLLPRDAACAARRTP